MNQALRSSAFAMVLVAGGVAPAAAEPQRQPPTITIAPSGQSEEETRDDIERAARQICKDGMGAYADKRAFRRCVEDTVALALAESGRACVGPSAQACAHAQAEAQE